MGTVLVVDDQFDLCTVMVRLLRLSGYDAACTTDGEAALAYVREHPPAVVILDLMMPGVSGFDVLAAMRADPRTRDVPVVLYSAADDPKTRAQAAALGAQDFLPKDGGGFDRVEAAVARFAGPPQ